MEDEKRRRKIAAGREKLAEYKKRKSNEKRNDSEQSSLSLSDTSLSLSPLPLSETANKPKSPTPAQEAAHSGSSSISENIELSNSNSENDRSLQEILVANIPLDTPEISLTSVVNNQQIDKKHSLQTSLLSDSSVISLNALEKFELENNNFIDSSQAQNILDEIIKNDQFDSKSESINSNPFDDLSSITLKSERITGCENKTSQHDLLSDSKNKSTEEEIMENKEPIVAQVNAEIDSLKELNSSNPSTLSTTEYKQYYDKLNLGAIEFQDLLSHRDDHIKQLTEALQQVLQDRNHLQEQTDYFAQEIALLQEQLVQTTEIIKKNKWNIASGNESASEDEHKPKCNPIQLEDTESTSLQSIAKNLKVNTTNITDINFDFEDPEFNETMTPEEKKIVADMRYKINLYIQQKVEESKQIFESEIKILRDRLEYEKNLNKNRFALSNKNTEDSISSLPSNEVHAKDLPDSIKSPKDSELKYEIDDKKFNETFTQEELEIMSDLRSKIFLFIKENIQQNKNDYDAEIKILKDRIENEKAEHDAEIDRLRQLLTSVKSGSVEVEQLRQELSKKHNTEMEELRTYFEKRCAEIEKHYSEEIFSQQSRKMSGSSVSELESEIFPAQLAAAGDTSALNPDGKMDFNQVRLELQNKYHAELEILREDYENRLDELKINHENKVQEIEKKYDILIKALKADLEEAQKNAVATQEVASSGDFEIAEVVESYERRLQEQVMLAKIDIVSALEQQIQTLVSSPSDNLEWPPELLQLRDRLTEHWHSEIQDIKKQHAQEIAQLKEDHEKHLNRALEREKRNSLKNGDDIEIRKERDSLKKISSNLRHLVAELIKYFTKCEDELNNTLVEELLKYGFDKDLSKIDSDLNDSSHSGSENLDTSLNPKVKRVHFTPDVSGIINIINDSTLLDLDTSKDISNEFRTELDLCLSRLKAEANAILTLSSNLKAKPVQIPADEPSKISPIEEKVTSLTRQLITETQVKNELNIQLEETKAYIQSLEAEKQSLENELEQMMAKQQVLNIELNNAKEKINDLIESGRKEIVSEGYGENQITGSTAIGGRITSFYELQEKARSVLAETEETSHHPLLQLIEELSRECNRIMEDAKKDHEDLIQQIEAADKKLRCTTQFLEEQAVERELERDEAQKEIAALREQLRDGERTRASCERINTEESRDTGKKLNACSSEFHASVLGTVEQLESQMREMTLVMNSCEAKKYEVENELKEAIDKIWVLRDIIRDLEAQIEEKSKSELDLRNSVKQLEIKIDLEVKHSQELLQKINSLEYCESADHYKELIRKLESENQKLKVSSELVGPDGVLKQVKTQLSEIEKTLEKRTKDLEALHTVITKSNCSSPSEDMSIRDQIRSQSSVDDNSDLPLEQLARLKDKLIRHARAEDAAMKRIRDLEMQLFTSKQEYEEMQSERDVLQEQLTEQMVIISSLQLRLDEQRMRVESAQKQTNTSFEHKIYELENEIHELKDAIHIRDNNNKQLNSVIEHTKKRIAEQEKQLNNAVDIEKQIVEQFESEISRLKIENDDLRKKLETMNLIKNEVVNSTSQTSNTFNADTVDSLLSEKNADIDRLKCKLSEIENDLKFYNSLNLTKDQLLHLSNRTNDPNFTSLIDISEPDQLRRQEQTFESIESGDNIEFKRNLNETVFIGSTFRDSKYADKVHSPFVASELSSIEKIGTSIDLSPSEVLKVSGDNSKSTKHVHFDENLEMTNLHSKITDLQDELQKKNETLKTYEVDLEKLRKKLEFSDETIRDKTEHFTEEIESLKQVEQNLRIELAQIKLELEQKLNQLECSEKECQRKDQMYMSLAKEKRDLETQYKELETRYAEFHNYEKIVEEKNKEIYQLEQQLATVSINEASTESLKEAILGKEKEVNDLINKLKSSESECKKLKQDISQLTLKYEEMQNELINKNNILQKKHEEVQNELINKNDILQKKDKDYQNLIDQCSDLANQVDQLKQMLDTRCEKIIEMERDLEREKGLRNKLAEYQQLINELQEQNKNYEIKLQTQAKENLKALTNNSSDQEVELSLHKKLVAKKDLELIQNKQMIDNLNKELNHLQEYLNEKDKIIYQMTTDSNSLHAALEAIQSKIQESGNVIDLKKRLREEQNLTNALHEELKYLKKSIDHFETNETSNVMETLVMLKESVEREKLTNLELTNTKETLLNELERTTNKLKAEEELTKKLQRLLDQEKISSNMVQMQDANIIESMRIRLEALLEHENESAKLLKLEQEARDALEKKLNAITKFVDYEINLQSEDTELRLSALKMKLDEITTQNEVLKTDSEAMNVLNNLLKSELQEMKDANLSQQQEINKLKRVIESMNFDKPAISHLNLNTSLDDIEQENKQLKQIVEELKVTVKKFKDRERELNQLLAKEQNKLLENNVPDKYLEKMGEMNSLLKMNMTDNKQLTNTVAILTKEKNLLQKRLMDLEEKSTSKPPFDDPTARADHLFGKYLKSESYRKALVFQKRYLLTLLVSYQQSSNLRNSFVSFVLPKTVTKRTNKFRVAAYAVMSILRMQYIVQRWHTGKRIGGSIITKRPIAPILSRPYTAGADFSNNSLNKSWRGNSPPTRHTSSRKQDLLLGDTIQESLTLAPLQAPALLSEYIERFDSIQQRLGLSIEKSTT